VHPFLQLEKQKVLHNLRASLEPDVSSVQCACAMLFVTCPAVQYLFISAARFWGEGVGVTERKRRVFTFSTTFA